MGLFLCHCCNEKIDLSHECEKDDIINYIDELKNRANKAEWELNNVKSDILKIVSQIPNIDDKTIILETSVIRDLWTAAKLCWKDAKTPEAFIYRWIAVHNILRRAFDLFRKSSYYQEPDDFLSKLKELHKSCEHAKEVLGYQSSVFQYKPEDLV